MAEVSIYISPNTSKRSLSSALSLVCNVSRSSLIFRVKGRYWGLVGTIAGTACKVRTRKQWRGEVDCTYKAILQSRWTDCTAFKHADRKNRCPQCCYKRRRGTGAGSRNSLPLYRQNWLTQYLLIPISLTMGIRCNWPQHNELDGVGKVVWYYSWRSSERSKVNLFLQTTIQMNSSQNRCHMAHHPNHATAVFLYRFFLWLIGVPIFFEFWRIQISQRNSSSNRFL